MDTEDEFKKLPIPDNYNKGYLDSLYHYLALTFSIPERAARALGALVGGSTLLLTKTLLPTAIRNSSSYRFTLGMFQTFLIRNVAGVDQFETDIELTDNFLRRKLLGTSLEAAGLLTMHLSPVWVFAIASDTAKGGQVFLNRLVHHLQDSRVIAKDSNPESLEQVLLSIHEMSRQAATAIDTPPLSVQEIRDLADELRRTTHSLAQNSSGLLPRFESIWNQIRRVAKKQDLSIKHVLGMLSVSAASVAETGIGTAGAIGKTGVGLLDEMVLNDYKKTLADISDTGAFDYMKGNMLPFVENAQSHFNFRQETWTQKWFKNTIGKIKVKLKS